MSEDTNRISQLAELADFVLIKTIEAMNGFSVIAASNMSAITDRLVVTATLARASCDYGRALITLLRIDHQDLGAPALSLLRTQLELALRSAFFGEHALDEELAYFLKNDDMPKRPDEKGELKRISLNRLAVIVEPTFALGSDSRMSDAVRASLKLLNGHVHGGTPLLNTYQGPSNTIGFVPFKGGTVQTLKYSYAFANLAMIVLAKVSGMDRSQHCTLFEAPYEAAERFSEALEQYAASKA